MQDDGVKITAMYKTLGELRIISTVVVHCGYTNHTEAFNQQTQESRNTCKFLFSSMQWAPEQVCSSSGMWILLGWYHE